jgi:hypothetical protein
LCTTIYIGALSAMSAMAEALGEEADRTSYWELAGRGARFIEAELFNGEYFEQRVQFRGLRDTSFLALIEGKQESKEGREMLQLLRKEGPRYQYGTGCLSDGVIGAWMARIYGIKTPLDLEKIRKNLLAIYRHNFRESLFQHANSQRPGYALGDESGLLLCSWPRGGKPTLPFVYSDEVWTGIEYQVATHLIAEGFVREGLDVVRAVRRRHDGRVRNPWNEYECGNYYARAMASYALLGALAGFRYSAVDQTLWFGPRRKTRSFQTFFSTEGAWGTISLERGEMTISVIEGRLAIRQVVFAEGNRTVQLKEPVLLREGKARAFAVQPSTQSPRINSHR